MRKSHLQYFTWHQARDPISPYIFNSVLEQVLRHVKQKWKAKKYGLDVDANLQEYLTNLRFADDLLLIGRSLPQIKQMLADLMIECEKVGLSLHPEKTKIMHNDRGYGSKVKEVKINGAEIEVLNGGKSTMYLGRLLALADTHEVEVSHRIRKAWTKFGVYKQELTDKMVPLNLRLKLFQAVVTPTALYGCGSWAMTAGREQCLQSTQMKMLRAICGYRRRKDPSGELEAWVDWVKRSTDEVKKNMIAAKMNTWPEEVFTRRKKWASRLEEMTSDRWAKRVSQWNPIGFRRRGRPEKRWEDDER